MFLAPNFKCFNKYDASCSHSFDCACLKRLRYIVMKRLEITEYFYSSKALLKMAGGVDASPTSPLDPALLTAWRHRLVVNYWKVYTCQQVHDLTPAAQAIGGGSG